MRVWLFLPVLLFGLAFLLLPIPARSRIITPDSPLIAPYNRLISCGEINNVVYGQRLWTTQDIQKQTSAIDPINPKGWCDADTVLLLTAQLTKLLNLSPRQPEKKWQFKAIENASLKYHFLSGGNASFINNNRGQIQSTINSFREYQHGRNLGTGQQLSLSTEHELVYKNLSLFLKPRIDALFSKNLSGIDTYAIFPEQGYGLVDIGPLRFLAGRAPLLWGEGEHGGFLFSDNARPLEQFQMTHPMPFRLPWIFSHMGQWKLASFFATQGPEQTFPWGFLAGLNVSYLPTADLQFHLHHAIQFGGQNAQSIGLFSGMREFFGFIPLISQTTQGGANKLTAASLRYRFHRAMGSQLYLEYGMDDSNLSNNFRAIKKHLEHNSLYRGGLWLSCLFNSCRDSARFEIVVNDPIAYRSGQFTKGWTQNNFILGDALGPDGAKAHFDYGHDWENDSKTRIDFNILHRQSNVYTVGADGITVTVTTYGPRERRMNWIITQDFPLGPFQISTNFGYEHIHNFNFINGNRESVLYLALSAMRSF